jgi:hypothetical protein
MGERKRNPSYYGRHEGGHDFRDQRFGPERGAHEAQHARDREERGEAGRQQGGRDRDYAAERDTIAGRYRGERRYGEPREPGARYGQEARALPNIYGSYDERIDRDDAERSRRWPYEPRIGEEHSRGRFDFGDRNYVDERDRDDRSPYAERPYGADWRSPARSRGYGRDDYRDFGERGYAQVDYYQRGDAPRRDWPERNLAQREWGERNDAERVRGYDERPYGERDYRGYEHGHGRAESLGHQLREAGRQVAQKVKRAFRGPKGYKRSDERIREDVSDRFAEQNYVDPSEIEVFVSNGEVTLSGTVEFRPEKFVAEQLADDVSGVTAVHNQLRLRRELQARGAGADGASPAVSSQSAGEAARNRNARA